MEQFDTDDGRPQIVVTFEYKDPETGKIVFVSRAVDKETYDNEPGALYAEADSMAQEFNETMKEQGF
ncbi:hypothetical protein OGV59_20610 [Citrobacter sp. CK187]|uniref:hypothetical protein n=1 Tax=Citrobacter sp. CK187 TaxID=2985096 RepID=UPI0025750AB3|nr:hypothetical protein [Citrobacter sp. CK187]ELO4690845.1 hypothetical protein [Citrobacter koseri]MDM3014426.1 hypothetical protein [Citrobacter sp. CK187]